MTAGDALPIAVAFLDRLLAAHNARLAGNVWEAAATPTALEAVALERLFGRAWVALTYVP